MDKFLHVTIVDRVCLFQHYLILDLWDHCLKKSWQFVDGLEDMEGLHVATLYWEIDVFV